MNDYLTIALPKGRLAEETVNLLDSRRIINKESINFKSRKLIFEDTKGKVRFLMIRNMDVPTYVEHGACDLGVVGKDILLELNPELYEFKDLGFGYCRLCVAAKRGGSNSYAHDMRVATKFVNITKDFFASRGVLVETVKLYGSIEIAPLLGLSDFIVDLVSTGETLKKNGLEEVETILESTARLVANKNLSKSKSERIKNIINVLDE
ncbi:ATP phosphoribosyltransferase [Flexistipes sp.]|uniref:ATP phosphoribosyltransferase n=1 Tax=Flexistipes sp. TaxID=3088135 RepID=UPI002E22BBDB|nr:ATP phosphoribosyltransferase [Flexistipes sp.]